MERSGTDGPVLRWETISTTREEDGVLNSKYLTERAKVPGGWLVISQFYVGSARATPRSGGRTLGR